MEFTLERRVPRALALAGALLAIGAAPAAQAQAQQGPAPAPGAVRLGDDILDPQSRAVITFEGTANIASFQQDGLLTYGDHQYAAWYRQDRRVVISRRALPNGDWQSIELDSHLQVDDSHNTISMAVSPSDGRLHLALGTHGTPIRYVRSVPGIASDTGAVAWSSRSFEPTVATLPGAPDAAPSWTYPMFELVRDRLYLTYRDGSTNNGRQVLARYDHVAEGTWSYLGQFTASTGTYTSRWGSSSSRYSYLHGFGANPVTGDIEISFSWRELSSAWCHPSGLGNHDLGYAASSDGGLTWRNNEGAQIGATGSSDMISIEDPHVVVPIDINRGLINQEAQTFDNAGRVHVMTSQFSDEDLAAIGGCHTATYPQRKQYARPVHHWRDADGVWHTAMLPWYANSAGRTKLLFDRHDTAYLVLPDARIAAATAASDWSDWRIVFAADDVDNIAELIVDRQRLRADGVLSVAYQETSAARDAPSAFRVADFTIDPGASPQPKATEPEAAPVPFEGSAPLPPGPRASATSAQAAFPAQLAVDGSRGTFWVSGGSTEGAGPQPDRPEVLTIEYPEVRPVREIAVVPRNASYGPAAFAIEARVDGAWSRLAEVRQGTAAATHVVPVTRTDAIRLVITAAHDVGRPPERSRNVQVAEVSLGMSDRVAPSSSATAPARSGSRSIAVGWSASDPEPSWGLERVELWVKGPREDGFSLAATDRAPSGGAGTFAYTADRGDGTYAFYTVAYDQAGRAEEAPARADAETLVVATPGGLCRLTHAYVAQSPKYQRLSPPARWVVDVAVAATCRTLDRLDQAPPRAREAILRAYVASLRGLAAAGWITEDQRAVLAELAAEL